MADSPKLLLPYLDQAQAQKHVTHNEALRVLDALVQAAVVDRDLAAPPASPGDGACYLVAAPATGVFAGHEGEIAQFEDGAWRFHQPRAGWRAFVADEALMLAHDGAAWAPLGHHLGAIDGVASFGLGASADGANAFVAKLRNAMFLAVPPAEAGDGDVQVKLVKNAPGDVAGLLYQTAFSGRAEAGLSGDDQYRVKVSDDGAIWRDGLAIDPATGIASFPSGAVAPAGFARSQVEVFDLSGTWTRPAWARWVLVIGIGGGGGGGSGRRSAASTQAGGGGGGSGGRYIERILPAAALGASEAVTIGAGGAGASPALDSQNGGGGGAGGNTLFGTALLARGGAGGSGGTATAGGAAGTAIAGTGWPVSGTEGNGGAGSAAATGANASSCARGPAGGGGGGGLGAADSESGAGVGGYSDFITSDSPARGTAGTPAAPNGGAGSATAGAMSTPAALSGAGSGGGGGASKAASAAGNGGAGGSYGAGGGGGGGGRNGLAGGAGGSGAPGLCVVISIG